MLFFNIMFMMFMMVSFFLVVFLYSSVIEEKVFILEWSLCFLSIYFEMKFYIYFDYISNIFLLVVSLISSTTFYFSKYYMSEDKYKIKFLVLTFIFIFSMYVMVLSINYFMIFLGWDGLGVVSYLLILHYQSHMSDYSGMTTISINRFGDVGMIFSFFIFVSDYCVDVIISNLSGGLIYVFLVFMVVGGLTKSAMYPFSTWLPLAMAAPTPISALVHSSTLVTAGVYLFIRFSVFFSNNSMLMVVMTFISMMTMVLSGFGALWDTDIKKIIAYSTMSQLGMMLMILFLGYYMLSFFHILTHALFKSMLFLCSGVLIHETLDNQDIRNFFKISKMNKFINSVYFVCSMSLCGFPFLSGFYSKDLIMELLYSMNFNMWFLVLMLIIIMLSSLYSMRLLFYSSLLGKKNSVLNICIIWSKIYNSFFMLFWFVLFLGSILSWVLIEKFCIFYFQKEVKMMTFILSVMGGMSFLLFNNFFMNLYKSKLFFTLLFLSDLQGVLMSVMLNKMNYFCTYCEMNLEIFQVFVFKKMILKVNNYLLLYKFILYYLIFLLILLVFFVF